MKNVVNINKTISMINKINRFIGEIVSYSVLFLMLLVVYEVISRRFFNSPKIWTFELITMIYGFHFMLLAAYAYLNNSYVSVDILYDKFKPKTKILIDLVTQLIFFFPFVIVVFYEGVKFVNRAIQLGERSWSGWAPIQWPIKIVIPISMVLLFFQGVSIFLCILSNLGNNIANNNNRE